MSDEVKINVQRRRVLDQASEMIHHRIVNKFSIIGELWRFMRARKKFWLLPLIVLIVLLGLLLVFAQASPLAPFIYTII